MLTLRAFRLLGRNLKMYICEFWVRDQIHQGVWLRLSMWPQQGF